MLTLGRWTIQHPTILAPMAGVTDAPFRDLCRQLGAGMAVSEMVTSDTRLWSSKKSQHRLSLGEHQQYMNTESHTHNHQEQPRSVQLAGNDPKMMADAAQANVALGADIIDINMGCPAKKVCKKAAGSALLQDEDLVKRILQSVVDAVDVPVTLKIRTGWSQDQRNGVTIARIAEDAGITALAVHGRTRACAFKGEAEYDTIADIVKQLSIPVFANGDITSAQKAKRVLDRTGAAAVMIGRGAQGNPWIFREINHYLTTGTLLSKPTQEEVSQTLLAHIKALHGYYGERMGVRIARKHVGWYLKQQAGNYEVFRKIFNNIESATEQTIAIHQFFEQSLLTTEDIKEEIAA